MQEPTIFRVVSGNGEVHAENLTSTAAYSMATFLVTNRNLQGVRTEPMGTAGQPAPQVVAYAVAYKMRHTKHGGFSLAHGGGGRN